MDSHVLNDSLKVRHKMGRREATTLGKCHKKGKEQNSFNSYFFSKACVALSELQKKTGNPSELVKDQGLVSCFVSRHWQVWACMHMCVSIYVCAHVCMSLCVYACTYVFVCLVLWYLCNWKKKDAILRELWWTTEVITDILVWTRTSQMWSRSKSILYLLPNQYLRSITRMIK